MNRETKELENDVKLLLKVLSSNADIPQHSDVRLLINSDNKRGKDGRIVLNNNLREISDYADEYETLKKQGVKWINLQCAGLLDSILVIVVEFSGSSRVAPHDATSINFSGPNKNESGSVEWDFNKHYALS